MPNFDRIYWEKWNSRWIESLYDFKSHIINNHTPCPFIHIMTFTHVDAFIFSTTVFREPWFTTCHASFGFSLLIPTAWHVLFDLKRHYALITLTSFKAFQPSAINIAAIVIQCVHLTVPLWPVKLFIHLWIVIWEFCILSLWFPSIFNTMYYFFSILYHIITVHRSLYLGRSFLTIGDIGWKMAILRILGIVSSKCSDYRMFEHSASFNDVRPYHHWSLALLPHSLPDVYTHVY